MAIFTNCRIFFLLTNLLFLSVVLHAQNLNVGSTVWMDVNEDGFQDPAEPGIPGVTLELYIIADSIALVQTLETDEQGDYRFDSLIRNETYEIRIDLNQPLFSKWNMKPTVYQNPISAAFDSDADDGFYPDHAVIRFEAISSTQNFDFGLMDARFEDQLVNLCENAFGAGIASFDLDRLRAQILEGTSGFQVALFSSRQALINNSDELTGSMLNTQDQTIYGAVRCVDGPVELQSMVRIDLNYIDSMDHMELSYQQCLGDEINFEDRLVFYRARYSQELDTFRMFTDSSFSAAAEIDKSSYEVTRLPDTLYFFASDTGRICFTTGRVILTEYPLHEVMLPGIHERICPDDTIFLSRFEASITTKDLCISDAFWTSATRGSFGIHPLDTFPGLAPEEQSNQAVEAVYYFPNEKDIERGKVELYYTVIDEPCGREVLDTVEVEIFPPGLFLECVNDTVDCNHAVADAITSEEHNTPLRLIDCEPSPIITLVSERMQTMPCDSPFVKMIARSWLFGDKETQISCMDTVFIRGSYLDEVTFPDTTVTLNCEQNFATIGESDTPAVSVTGVPMVGDIPIYPSDKLCGWSSSFEDQIFEGTCPGERPSLKRIWSVFNNCTGAKHSFEQWIEINSTLGAIVTIADFEYLSRDRNHFVISLNDPHTCGAIIDPSFRVALSCSGVRSMQYRVLESSQRGELEERNNLWHFAQPLSLEYVGQEYTLRLYSIDSCWNVDSTTYTLDFEDFRIPKIYLDDERHFKVQQDLHALSVSHLIDKHEDNCFTDQVVVRREDWKEKLQIQCLDTTDLRLETIDDLFQMRLSSVLRTLLPRDKMSDGFIDYVRQLERAHKRSDSLIYAGLQYDLISDWIQNCLLDDHQLPRFTLDQVEQGFESRGFDALKLQQIKGGWMPYLMLCCQDACTGLDLKYLAIDVPGNINFAWNTMNVEYDLNYDVVRELPDITINCQTLAEHEVLDLIDQENVEALHELFGQYVYSEDSSQTFVLKEYTCERFDSTFIETVINHDNEEEQVKIQRPFYRLASSASNYEHGLLLSNCAAFELEQDYWVDLDECNEGRIIRRIFLVTECGHQQRQLIDEQTILVEKDPACALDSAMFEFPRDATVAGIFQYNPDGTIMTPAPITFVRPLFNAFCTPYGETYDDLVFPTADENVVRIERTWQIRDWCSPRVLTYVQRLLFFQIDLARSNPKWEVTASPLPIIAGSELKLRFQYKDEHYENPSDLSVELFNPQGQLIQTTHLQTGSLTHSLLLNPSLLSQPSGVLFGRVIDHHHHTVSHFKLPFIR